jgi:hypothetical protein
MAVATGRGSVGPPGLKREGRSSELKQFQHPEPFRTGGTPVPQFGFRKRLSVYPHHQPRRGDITPAGAARPLGFQGETSIHRDAT